MNAYARVRSSKGWPTIQKQLDKLLVVNAEYTRVLWLDADLQPTSKEHAVLVKCYKSDGTTVYGGVQ